MTVSDEPTHKGHLHSFDCQAQGDVSFMMVVSTLSRVNSDVWTVRVMIVVATVAYMDRRQGRSLIFVMRWVLIVL